MTKKPGFTLIELLVVISIIGTLVGLIVNNMADARARARDAKRKSGLSQLKTALRLYYNDYQHYPTGAGTTFNGCGPDGSDVCPEAGIFSAGSGDSTIYMREIPADIQYQSAGEDSFTTKAVLENASDPDILSSQLACPDGAPYAETEFAVCAD